MPPSSEAAGSDWRVMRDIDIPYFAQLAVNAFPSCGTHYTWYWESNDYRLDRCDWHLQPYEERFIPNSDTTCAYNVSWEGDGTESEPISGYLRTCFIVTEVQAEVEYDSCFSYDLGVMETCVATKLNDGWQPMPGGSASSGLFQGFWRYAE